MLELVLRRSEGMSSKDLVLHVIFGRYSKGTRNCFSSTTITKVMSQLSKTECQPNKLSSLLDSANTGAAYFRLLHNVNCPSKLRLFHAHMIKCGCLTGSFLFNCLLYKYAKSGILEDARQVFDRMPERDVVSWNSMITGYVQCRHDTEALRLFCKLQRDGLTPSQPTFVNLLVACANTEALQYGYILNGCVEEGLKLVRNIVRVGVKVSQFGFSGVLSVCVGSEFGEQGKQLQAYILKIGFINDVSIGNALISMYAKSKSMEDASKVFYVLWSRDIVSWNTMISGYAQNGNADIGVKIFFEMQLAGVKPNQSTISSFVTSCAGIKCLEKTRQIHAQIKKVVGDLDISAENAILSMYVRCGSIDYAHHTFQKMVERNSISWNTMIAGYTQYGFGKEALHLFNEMQWEGVKVNHVTISSALNACSSLVSLELGKELHSVIVKSGLERNIFIENALLIMYEKCGNVEDAFRIFTKMPERDVVSWNMMIGGYAQNGHSKAGLDLFWKMQQAGIILNRFTLANVLSACSGSKDLGKGQQVHAYIVKCRFQFDVTLMNALVTMYNKCGSVREAYELFTEMTIEDAITWSAMIAGFSRYGYSKEALELLCQMHHAGIKMHQMTFASVLKACGNLAALEQGKQFHAQIIRNGMESDISVDNSVITMYSKCANIEDARRVFENMAGQDIVSWNAMIAGFAHHGQGKEALELFGKMQLAGIKPDHITYVGVLSACSHVGLVEKGYRYFNSMERDYGIIPREEHYSCMVDLLARAGQLVDAELFINKMPFEPGSLVWRTLLGACRLHCNVELGERAAARLLKLESQDMSTYVLLSNIYASAGRWDDRANLRKLMKDKRMIKDPGCSWIQVKNTMHTFFARERSLAETEQIFAELC
ncbi:pentatricopeptide repeat-containing protein At2g13600 isoform X2 [Cryptomeria japonica]|uniref:pentatricopeptide repeat-containing protein At2g13600 isoform X2 n=1 Tax=Cryptomeria japonica TaxID=3369 RepID=UPI0025AC3EFA|nr:pentatricopeptide repeat-containing protein At2g13600 isoform X2 [Cryptomeria japonica]